MELEISDDQQLDIITSKLTALIPALRAKGAALSGSRELFREADSEFDAVLAEYSPLVAQYNKLATKLERFPLVSVLEKLRT